MNLFTAHRTFLLQSVTLPGIIAQEIAGRKRLEQITEIGRLHIIQENPPPDAPLLGDEAEATHST